MLIASFTLLPILLGLVSASAKCGENIGKCPSETPCCSPYGDCGTGSFCLQGCDPRYSTSVNSCNPQPICRSMNHTFNDLTGVTNSSVYLGDANTALFVTSLGTPLINQGSLLLTMPKNSGGTVIATAMYIFYGKISAKIKTSRGQGVVSAFILMSDVKDEIDFEFVGADLKTAQTNYYYEGILNYDQGKNITGFSGDTFDDWHVYEIDWSPDQITWSVDGQYSRTLKKSDTLNTTTGRYEYPQTPSRVSLSLWPAGDPNNPKGTIDWAGGVINWDSQDIQKYGYDYMSVQNINIECYAPPSDVKVQGGGGVSYIYSSENLGQEDSVIITNLNTTLASFLATGTNQTIESSSGSSDSGQQTAAPGGGSSDRGSNSTAGNGSNTSSNGSNSEGTDNSGVKNSSSSKSTLNFGSVTILLTIALAVVILL